MEEPQTQEDGTDPFGKEAHLEEVGREFLVKVRRRSETLEPQSDYPLLSSLPDRTKMVR